MFVMFTEWLFLGVQTVCSIFTGLWYGQEKLWYPALLILPEIPHNKCLCSRHFSGSDFTTAERVHLNRVAVPCGLDSASQSSPQSLDKVSMGINSWILLKNGKPAFCHPPPSQNGWLIFSDCFQNRPWRGAQKICLFSGSQVINLSSYYKQESVCIMCRIDTLTVVFSEFCYIMV
jgi:hypothetical protein